MMSVVVFMSSMADTGHIPVVHTCPHFTLLYQGKGQDTDRASELFSRVQVRLCDLRVQVMRL